MLWGDTEWWSYSMVTPQPQHLIHSCAVCEKTEATNAQTPQLKIETQESVVPVGFKASTHQLKTQAWCTAQVSSQENQII